MKKISQVLNWLSSLKIAILLLLLIAISCAAGTAIPQQEQDQFYYDNFNKNPFLGIINGFTERINFKDFSKELFLIFNLFCHFFSNS